MTEEKEKDKDSSSMQSEKGVDTSSLHSSTPPPPGHQETMAENIQQSQIDATDPLEHAKTSQSNKEPEYPSRKKLIPTVIALYLAFFLVALVCDSPLDTPLRSPG